MIGDAEVDILMGKAAGIKTCAVTWGSHTEERLMSTTPDFLVRSVNELLPVIEKL
jgi:phosphoglycolate phosphatase-like HAD superfamily hydrolase